MNMIYMKDIIWQFSFTNCHRKNAIKLLTVAMLFYGNFPIHHLYFYQHLYLMYHTLICICIMLTNACIPQFYIDSFIVFTKCQWLFDCFKCICILYLYLYHHLYLSFDLYFYRTQVNLGSDLWVRMSVCLSETKTPL